LVIYKFYSSLFRVNKIVYNKIKFPVF